MIKQAALKLMATTGAFAPFRWVSRDGVLIVLYHRFGDARDGVTVPPRVFARQVDYLKAHYRLVALSAVCDHLNAGVKLPRGLAVITIDDGYRDCYEAAFPILRGRSAPATVFLCTDFVSQRAWMPADRALFITAQAPAGEYLVKIGRERLRLTLGDGASRERAAARINAALRALPDEEKDGAVVRVSARLGAPLPARPAEQFGALDWESAREMARSGIEFGSHTRTHPALTGVGDERLRRELSDSRAQIESELGRAAELFSYPHGEIDGRVREAVGRAGYRCAVSSEPGLNGAKGDLLALRRIQAEPDLPHFIQATSGCEQFKKRLRGARSTSIIHRQSEVRRPDIGRSSSDSGQTASLKGIFET